MSIYGLVLDVLTSHFDGFGLADVDERAEIDGTNLSDWVEWMLCMLEVAVSSL